MPLYVLKARYSLVKGVSSLCAEHLADILFPELQDTMYHLSWKALPNDVGRMFLLNLKQEQAAEPHCKWRRRIR